MIWLGIGILFVVVFVVGIIVTCKELPQPVVAQQASVNQKLDDAKDDMIYWEFCELLDVGDADSFDGTPAIYVHLYNQRIDQQTTIALGYDDAEKLAQS